MDWKQALNAKDGDSTEVRNLKAAVIQWEKKYRRTVRLCKAIWEYETIIWAIKHHLLYSEEPAASELWNNLDYEVQRLLITAPLYGGAFTTAEVKKIKELWEITADEL